MRKRIMFWLHDGPISEWLCDHNIGWLDSAYSHLIDAVADVLCALYDHEPICDQCHKPEHDFCCWCHKRMPGQAHRAP